MSMEGYTMRFPVIKVRDHDLGWTHIVGTDSHDSLYVDDKTGGLHYDNLQNGEGTGGAYSFVGEKGELYNPDIEFVSFEGLMDIYAEHVKDIVKHEKRYREVIQPMLRECFDEMWGETDGGITHS